MTLLVLRPQPGADRTAARARAAGLDVDVYPLFAVEPVDWTGPDPAGPDPAGPNSAGVDAILVTSANVARHGGPGLARYRHLPAYAVGAATAAALHAAGFASVIAGKGGVQDAIRLIEARGHGHALHLSGVHIRPYGAHATRISRVAVYAARPSGDGAGLAAHLRAGAILLLHSTRAGARQIGRAHV